MDVSLWICVDVSVDVLVACGGVLIDGCLVSCMRVEVYVDMCEHVHAG